MVTRVAEGTRGMKKRIFKILGGVVLAAFMFAHTALAQFVTFCTNCSDIITQAMQQATNIEQLSQLYEQVSQAVQQTQQQIQMVQNGIQQYENMLKNTAQLPANLINELKGNFTKLASLSSTLRTQTGDITALGQVFTKLFPAQSQLGSTAGASPAQAEQASAQYADQWNTWASNVDQATQATFQLSGQQLSDLQQNPEQFQSYIDNLLSTPDGQQQAIMAGNQLAALQIQEARQLRELTATQVQSAIASQMKAEKESQMTRELWKGMSKTDKLGGLSSKPDPF